jgi:hypothetical protein
MRVFVRSIVLATELGENMCSVGTVVNLGANSNESAGACQIHVAITPTSEIVEAILE